MPLERLHGREVDPPPPYKREDVPAATQDLAQESSPPNNLSSSSPDPPANPPTENEASSCPALSAPSLSASPLNPPAGNSACTLVFTRREPEIIDPEVIEIPSDSDTASPVKNGKRKATPSPTRDLKGKRKRATSPRLSPIRDLKGKRKRATSPSPIRDLKGKRKRAASPRPIRNSTGKITRVAAPDIIEILSDSSSDSSSDSTLPDEEASEYESDGSWWVNLAEILKKRKPSAADTRVVRGPPKLGKYIYIFDGDDMIRRLRCPAHSDATVSTSSPPPPNLLPPTLEDALSGSSQPSLEVPGGENAVAGPSHDPPRLQPFPDVENAVAGPSRAGAESEAVNTPPVGIDYDDYLFDDEDPDMLEELADMAANPLRRSK